MCNAMLIGAIADCWSFPHILHMAVAMLAILVFVALASFFILAEVELNPIARKNIFGAAHTGCVTALPEDKALSQCCKQATTASKSQYTSVTQ
jgi:hypothetical protein